MLALQQAGRHRAAAHAGRAAGGSALILGDRGENIYIEKKKRFTASMLATVFSRVMTRHPFTHRHIYRQTDITVALLGRQGAG